MYDHNAIEHKWQQFWESNGFFQNAAHFVVPNEAKDVEKRDGDDFAKAEKLYLLFAFAYPSGSGLHVGHVESKTALDILARYYRMKGKQVFFPVGWDAFGLPAENYAIKTGIPPAVTTKNAIDTFRGQIKRLGISYDWANEIATNHPEYYRWTQWLFLQLYSKGLAYQGTGMVNWCPSCQTVLANEQVVNGECERCGTQVIQKEMKQWFFKITDYKDELISGLDQVDWPNATKQQQLNWIGKSEGVEITFAIKGEPTKLACFTTRIDTVYGVTFIAVSPEKFKELGLLDRLPADRQAVVTDYLTAAEKKTEEQRKIGEKDKTGVETGLQAINPVNGAEVPIYVADYVLGGYGTGALMGVPAHDERDLAFAKKFSLPVIEVVAADGALVNSGKHSGLPSAEAMAGIPADFAEQMQPVTTYKLRDWLISRQRYWGAPIPVVYDPEGNPHPVKEEHLPWLLPTDVDFKPTGESPLRSSKELIERTERLYGNGWRPEYDTMDTFVDSSWYYLRYISSRDNERFADPQQLRNWLPVDFYMIGPEHIVLHLLYSRFFTKFLRDQGYLNFDEPFMKMRHQGMILGPDGRKMSKSKGNVINPDEVIEKFGADTLRMYEMFMGPIESDKPWSVTAVAGVYRMLQRWDAQFRQQLSVADKPIVIGENDQQPVVIQRRLHQLIAKISTDIPSLKFNTAIAAMMEFLNDWEKATYSFSVEELSMLVRIIAPFAPFLAEELWQLLPTAGERATSVHLAEWPVADPELAKAAEVTIPVQVDGKVRAKLSVTQDELPEHKVVLDKALQHPDVQRFIAGKTVSKQLYVAGRIVSLVTA